MGARRCQPGPQHLLGGWVNRQVGSPRPVADRRGDRGPRRVELTRDSVAMGDDVDAPHTYYLELPAGASLGEAVGAALAVGYLARLHGGRATWLVLLDRDAPAPQAVVAQQWEAPRWLTNPDIAAPACLHFRYLRQRDPEVVYREYHG